MSRSCKQRYRAASGLLFRQVLRKMPSEISRFDTLLEKRIILTMVSFVHVSSIAFLSIEHLFNLNFATIGKLIQQKS
ncbi:MAG: hypothetical protein A3I66_02500 [Burkholderiales bacterium RIFCSPLOWO2_02_FULL_57_36]|nr:MAG: hypothetical protein A3I66_02500 [Burkholderiales bacterium RIFCSPLOWO2_02_FULL_57_36]